MALLTHRSETAWKDLPRKYPLGTRVTKTFGKQKVHVGVVRGYQNRLNAQGHATGQTINWVVYDERILVRLQDNHLFLTDPRMRSLHPELPTGTCVLRVCIRLES